MKLKSEELARTSKGEAIFLYTLRNDYGITVKIINYGATITSITMPDRNGNIDNIVLGFSSPEDYFSENYIANCPCFGCVCGRYANRISKGKFSLNGKEYTLAVNNGANHLHGGVKGFDKVMWSSEKVEKPGIVGVEMSYLSPHMEEGYPGNYSVKVAYTLNNDGELQIAYEATTDKPTVHNLTNHTYFNLLGRGDIFNHTLQIYAKRYTVTDKTLIPTGEIANVKNTPFDFTSPHEIGAKIDELKEGYDLNYILENNGGGLIKACTLSEKLSGRVVKIFTTEPAMQFYSGYYIGEIEGKNGEKFGRYSGLALETQHYPDSPNHPNFPTSELHPGEVFQSKTIYKFETL